MCYVIFVLRYPEMLFSFRTVLSASSPRQRDARYLSPKPRKLNNTAYDDDGSALDGHNDARYAQQHAHHPEHEHDDDAPLRHQNGKMRGRDEDDVYLRGRDVCQHASKPLQNDERRHGQLLHDDERHDDDDLQLDHGHVQMRNDQGWHDDQLHERRRRLLQNDPVLLRLYVRDDEGRLHVLRVHERRAGLLRLLLILAFPPDYWRIFESAGCMRPADFLRPLPVSIC